MPLFKRQPMLIISCPNIGQISWVATQLVEDSLYHIFADGSLVEDDILEEWLETETEGILFDEEGGVKISPLLHEQEYWNLVKDPHAMTEFYTYEALGILNHLFQLNKDKLAEVSNTLSVERYWVIRHLPNHWLIKLYGDPK
ncbi:hypothetical protein FLI59_30965 [Pseudomonas aeruginosa]|nr:hypothetical protein FLI59_30965 [Pseudomonas aeruginosa]